MGDWWYYVTTMTFSDVSVRVKPIEDIEERKELKTWLQRKLTPERREQICEYLLLQPQHFFGAVVVGIYDGEPEWFPVTVGESRNASDVKIDYRTETAIGLLSLRGDEEIFAIDGQHRVEGIKEAYARNPEIGEEEQCIIFVGHNTTEEGHERTRRLFSTLNKYAKPVSKAEIIALNDDDTFAVITRRLIDEYPGLNMELVAFTQTSNIPSSEKKYFTNLLTLYDLVRVLAVPNNRQGSLERSKLEKALPDKSALEIMYRQQCNWWNNLKDFVPAVAEVLTQPSNKDVAGKYRTATGGHILFRPVGLISFAKAARTLMDRRKPLEEIVELLSSVPLELNAEPWTDVLWDASRNKVKNNGTLASNLFLYMLGEEAQVARYDMLGAYRKSLGDDGATLDNVPLMTRKSN